MINISEFAASTLSVVPHPVADFALAENEPVTEPAAYTLSWSGAAVLAVALTSDHLTTATKKATVPVWLTEKRTPVVVAEDW